MCPGADPWCCTFATQAADSLPSPIPGIPLLKPGHSHTRLHHSVSTFIYSRVLTMVNCLVSMPAPPLTLRHALLPTAERGHTAPLLCSSALTQPLSSPSIPTLSWKEKSCSEPLAQHLAPCHTQTVLSGDSTSLPWVWSLLCPSHRTLPPPSLIPWYWPLVSIKRGNCCAFCPPSCPTVDERVHSRFLPSLSRK